MRLLRRIAWIPVAALCTLAACGGGDGGSAAATCADTSPLCDAGIDATSDAARGDDGALGSRDGSSDGSGDAAGDGAKSDGGADANGDGGKPTVALPAPGAGAMWGGARLGIVLMTDGTVWDWGADYSGHLGDGDPIQDVHAPVQVLGALGVGHLSSITAIASGEMFSTALRSDGTVWTWGDNMFGELGNGNAPTNSTVPVQVHGAGNVGLLTSIVAVGSRGYHALAVASDTSVWAWGFNSAGQLGDGNAGTNGTAPVHVKGPAGVGLFSGATAVTGGYTHSLALKSDATVWAWGGNDLGQIGNGGASPVPFPIQVDATDLTGVTQVSAGWKHSLALRSDKTVWAWGQNDLGEIGDGCSVAINCANALTPFHVPITNVVAVSGGDCHSAALKADGTVWTWGCNHHNGKNPAVDPVGQLGNGDATYTDSSVPVQVHGPNNVGFLTSIVAIAARDYHNYALRSDGTLWSWGSNLNGQLGNGTCCAPSTYPVQVSLP